MNDMCKNCGGWKGIHHWKTNQCPIGGREAPLGRKQEYKSTVFEADDTDQKDATIAAQAERIAELQSILNQVDRCSVECHECEGSGINQAFDFGDNACGVCGGYGFNVKGDIREVVLSIRALLTAKAAS